MLTAFKARRPWAAVLIDLLLSPFAAMLYLNKGKLALAYLSADVAMTVAVLAAFPFQEGHSLGPFLSLPLIVPTLVGAVHAGWLARNGTLSNHGIGILAGIGCPAFFSCFPRRRS